MKNVLPALIVVVAALPAVGYLLTRSRGMHRVAPDVGASLSAPLTALQRQSRLLDGERPDAAAVCGLNSVRLRARITCDDYVALVRSRLAGFVGATLDVTSLAGDPQRDVLVLMGVAAVGPHGSAEFSARMVREGGEWHVGDLLRYGASLLP